jgi:hypothetical protein
MTAVSVPNYLIPSGSYGSAAVPGGKRALEQDAVQLRSKSKSFKASETFLASSAASIARIASRVIPDRPVLQLSYATVENSAGINRSFHIHSNFDRFKFTMSLQGNLYCPMVSHRVDNVLSN